MYKNIAFYAEIYIYICINFNIYKKSYNSTKRLRMNPESVAQANPSVYYCEPCAYNCKDTRAFKKHVASTKHKKNIVTVIPVVEEYKCSICQCVYQHKRSLTRHQKTCSEDIVNTTINAIPQHIIDTIISRAQFPTQQQVQTQYQQDRLTHLVMKTMIV